MINKNKMKLTTKKDKVFIIKKSNLFLSIGFLLVTSLLFVLGCSPDETQTVANFTNLTMADEFDTAGAPSPEIWSYNVGTGDNGWGNNELQYYTDRPENIVVEDGMLKFTVRQESLEGSGYTSARILTKGEFDQKYGRFEARIQLPWGQGLWPAFWMLGANIDEVGWPQCGEIDIMENRGQEPTLIGGAVHGPGYSGAQAISKAYALENDRFDTGFHVFGIEWGENYINYYVDDVLYNQIRPDDVTGEWVYNESFFIVMNVAVGGGYVGAPDASTVFPQEMLVDYVRVYSAD
jgi:beta-glucanase (GH16 family)